MNMTPTTTSSRTTKGLEIASRGRIRHNATLHAVPSQSSNVTYLVNLQAPVGNRCGCPDHQFRRTECKHQIAARAGSAPQLQPQPPATPQVATLALAARRSLIRVNTSVNAVAFLPGFMM